MQVLTYADLFAGIGGMRMAFDACGCKCTLTCEIDPDAKVTYLANFPSDSDHVFHDDIRTLAKLPEGVDLVVAGFPCQPYSIAGLRKGLSDSRGGDIFTAMLCLLQKHKPRAFLLENVKGIVNHDHGRTFQYMLDELQRCGGEPGYSIKHQVLNSMTHANVPQNRERVFIVGFLNPEMASGFEFPEPVPLRQSITDCLEKGSVDAKYYYDARYDCFHEISLNVRSRETLYQWRRQYVRENKSNVCPTLTANMGSGGHNVPLVLDDVGIRKLTPRETAMFQGFPADFILPKISDSRLYHQFGNSVTVPLIARIAENMVRCLKGI